MASGRVGRGSGCAAIQASTASTASAKDRFDFRRAEPVQDIANGRVRGRALPVDLFYRILADFRGIAQGERPCRIGLIP